MNNILNSISQATSVSSNDSIAIVHDNKLYQVSQLKIGDQVSIKDVKTSGIYIGYIEIDGIKTELYANGGNFDDLDIQFSPESYDYTGSPIEVTNLVVKKGTETLVKDEDYVVSYTNNTNAGTAQVIISAKEGNVKGYNGSKSKDFIIKSVLGLNWIKVSNFDKPVSSLTYGNGMYIAGTVGYGIWYSDDGTNWNQSNISDAFVNSITYGNGIFLACLGFSAFSSSVGIWKSSDGINWIEVDSNKDFYRIIYGDGKFITGSDNSAYSGLHYSLDNGENWINNTQIYRSGTYALTYGNGKFIASLTNVYDYDPKGIWYSTDGIKWYQSSLNTNYWRCLTYGNGKFITGDGFYNHGIYYSSDGMNWIQSNCILGDFSTLSYGNESYIAGSHSISANPITPGIYYSKDGVNWSNVLQITYISSSTYGNNKFLVGVNNSPTNSGSIWYSE